MDFRVDLERLPRAVGPAALPGAKARGRDRRHPHRHDHRPVPRLPGGAGAIGRQRGGRLPRHGRLADRDQVAAGAAPQRRGARGAGRPAAGTGPAAAGVQALPRRGQHVGRVRPGLAAALSRGSPATCPATSGDLADEPIREVELWDLVSAFGRIIRENVATKPSNIVYDDTPIHVYMERIHGRLVERGHLAFSDLFDAGMHKSALIGIFLAVLELVRHHRVRVRAERPVRRNLGAARRQLQPAAGPVRRRQLRARHRTRRKWGMRSDCETASDAATPIPALVIPIPNPQSLIPRPSWSTTFPSRRSRTRT